MRNTRAILMIILYILLQCTWGILQTLVGLVLFFVQHKKNHDFYHGSIRTQWAARSGVSLGLFIFVAADCSGKVSDKMSIHEYGHTLQSLLLGPLYLLIIGLPSFIWFQYFQVKRKKKQISYSSFFIEKWADLWGEKGVKFL